jgi:hypothetical protein
MLREELLPTITKVRGSILSLLYECYSSGHKWIRAETHFREVSLSRVLHIRGVLRPRGQKQAQSQGNSTHSRNTPSNCRQYPEHTRKSTNNCKNHARYFKYQRCLATRDILRLVLFILGSWLVTDVDAFFSLTLASSNLMVVNEVDLLSLSRGVQICRSSCLASH